MKLTLIALFLAVALATVFATPVNDVGQGNVEERALRHRRVTCDLLSFGGKVGDSACAANCLSLGKAGGRCNKGVCQCRKTTLKDLLDQRFG